MVSALPTSKLRRESDVKLMGCETTAELKPLEEIIGQDRAVRALKFGLDIRSRGFNIYVAGSPGTGRTTAVQDFVDDIAKTKPEPPDWCYVNNFRDSYEPNAIMLPSGRGKEFQRDLKDFIDEVRRALPKAFESEDYSNKREAIIKSVEKERNDLFTQINKKAQAEGFIIQATPAGLFITPAVGGKPMSDEQLAALDPKITEELGRRRDKLYSDMRSAMVQLGGMERKTREEIQKLNRDVTLYTIGHLVTAMLDKYKDFPEVKTYLEAVRDDIPENLPQFIGERKQQPNLPFPSAWLEELPFRKYEVNVVVDNSETHGAPVVIERNPTYQNLFGKIEKEARFGVLTTDFTMIRGGSLHKANGGYLVLPVEEMLIQPLSYDSLKRALMDESIEIEEPAERLGFLSTKSVKPEPIHLDAKVILIGDPYIYQQLYVLDKNFRELFKVKADFDTTMDRTEETMRDYVAFICTLCQKENLKHLDASGAAKIVEYGSRLAEDQEKLSTSFSQIADIIREANFYAAQDGSSYVTAKHVMKAIDEKTYRSNLIQTKIQEMMEREFILIDTEGEKVGQINGLSVMELGDFAFGAPSRVTATIGLGREGIIDIQREAKLAGPIYTKGVLILGGYISEKYAQDKPLSLSMRLVFEQSYGMVEGDSASSTELYAILSALSGVPIRQDLAVTGSVNQRGEVQAIGGVNEKIEGFFEVCKAKGLTGKQGVLIPESNVQNLMLKEEVVDAVKAGKFQVYSVKTIDEGIEVLTGKKAGTRQPDGSYEEDTINYLVNKRLREMADTLREEFPVFTAEKAEKEESGT